MHGLSFFLLGFASITGAALAVAILCVGIHALYKKGDLIDFLISALVIVSITALGFAIR